MTRYFFTVLLLILSIGIPLGLSLQENRPEAAVVLTSKDEGEDEDKDEDETKTEGIETDSEASTTLPPLTDIVGHWAEDEINNLYYAEVIHGYGDGTFGPDDPVTRFQLLKIILGAFDYEVEDEAYADYAYDIGIISNLDLWKNHPNDPVIRAEALKVILETSGLDEGTALTPNFADVDTVNDWFAVYSAFAKAQGISTGDAEGNFNGSDNVSRAEVCALTVRVMERLPSEE